MAALRGLDCISHGLCDLRSLSIYMNDLFDKQKSLLTFLIQQIEYTAILACILS